MSLPNGWKIAKLESLVNFSSGGTPSKNNPEFWKGSIPWISASTMHTQNIYVSDLMISEEGLNSGSRLAQEGDLLLLVRGSMLWNKVPICICKRSVAFNQDVKGISVGSKILSEYLLYWFLTHQQFLLNKVVGTGIGAGKLDSNDLLNLEILLPTLPEQKAIADLLSIWDAAIEKTEQLIKAKEKQFQWLLNELITKPSQSGKWKEVRLGDVAMMSSGGTPKSSVSEYYDGDILWVSIKDITQQGMFINDTERKLTALGLRNSAAKIFPKGCVLYAMYASIGEVSITNCDVSTSQAILGIQPNDCVNNHFLYHFLVSLKEKIKLQGQSGTQSNLNAQMVKDFRLPLPSIKEQNRIVMHLEICKQEMQLLTFLANKYKTQKRGLMQKLLNGQWRVKEFK